MLTLTHPLKTPDLVKAISLRCSPVFGSLSIANALGGSENDAWKVVRGFTLVQLVDEAVRRGVDLSEVKAACCDVLVFDTPPFHGAIGYDSRARCPLCCRRHYVDKNAGAPPLSCGDAARFRNPPVWQWMRAVAHDVMEEKIK
jgi:hypothetical protein